MFYMHILYSSFICILYVNILNILFFEYLIKII